MPGKQNGTAGTNGAATKGGGRERFHFDPDDPEYIRDLQRPAVIKEDVHEMTRRKRVHEILDSKPFRKELEELIHHERSVGNNPENLKTLEQLSQLVLPKGQLAAASLHGISSGAIVPIADLRGPEASRFSKAELAGRNNLAALYRLIDLFQWSQGIYNHVTLRVGDSSSEEFLINPFGLLYHEVSAASLIKVDVAGKVVDGGSTGMGINDAGFALHAAIHKARPEVRCVIHVHTPVVGAVAAMKPGLLPICQEAMIVGPVSYHDFRGLVEEDEQESILRDLKPESKVMLLRNHGCVVLGESVAEALHLVYHTVLACETQIRAARAGLENLVIPDEDAQRRCFEKARQGGGGVLRSPGAEGKKVAWRCGELEWEAWMRVLDNAGFRSGHNYRQPLLRSQQTLSARSHHSEVEAPPCASSYGTLEGEEPTSAALAKLEAMRREAEKTRWLNSPNVYQKVEFLESGTSEPKKITKWIVDPTSPQHSTPVKIGDIHQFSPVSGQSSKEFKAKQRAIKERRREGQISAGPQSQILDGVSYEEMAAMNKDAEMSGAAEGIGIMTIGTASKGIIDRNFQHNAQVYRQMYAPNPFASETDEDIAKYMSDVKAKVPLSPSREANGATPHAPASPTTESPNAETISLMQAARECRRDSRQPSASPEKAMSASASKGGATERTNLDKTGWRRETTFDAVDVLPRTRKVHHQQRPASSYGGFFSRGSKSERPQKKKDQRRSADMSSTGDRLAASDDENREKSPGKGKEKKKRKSLVPAFLRSKKKESAASTAV